MFVPYLIENVINLSNNTDFSVYFNDKPLFKYYSEKRILKADNESGITWAYQLNDEYNEPICIMTNHAIFVLSELKEQYEFLNETPEDYFSSLIDILVEVDIPELDFYEQGELLIYDEFGLYIKNNIPSYIIIKEGLIKIHCYVDELNNDKLINMLKTSYNDIGAELVIIDDMNKLNKKTIKKFYSVYDIKNDKLKIREVDEVKYKIRNNMIILNDNSIYDYLSSVFEDYNMMFITKNSENTIDRILKYIKEIFSYYAEPKEIELLLKILKKYNINDYEIHNVVKIKDGKIVWIGDQIDITQNLRKYMNIECLLKNEL